MAGVLVSIQKVAAVLVGIYGICLTISETAVTSSLSIQIAQFIEGILIVVGAVVWFWIADLIEKKLQKEVPSSDRN